MAPSASPLPIDLRAQVIENCEFYSGPHARISLVIAKQPVGTWKAYVFRTVNGTREALLSETAPSLPDALQALHVKSAEAVQNYIGSNGFALVSGVKKRGAKRGGSSHDDGHDSDSTSSTVTLDDCESLSDDETISVTSVGRAKRSRRKANKSGKASSSKHKPRHGRPRSRSPSFSATRARSRSRSRSRYTCSSSSESDLDDYNPPIIPSRRPPFLNAFTQRLPPRPPHNGFSTFLAGHHPPPPPPPGPPMNWNPPVVVSGGNGSGGPNPGMGPAAPPLPPPPPPPFPYNITNRPPVHAPGPIPPPAPAQAPIPIQTITTPTSPNPPHPGPPPHHNHHQQKKPHDLVLHITWRPHGERRTLEQMSHITPRALQMAALAFVRRQPEAFGTTTTTNQGSGVPGVAGLRAVVKGVVVDGVSYDLSGWVGEDRDLGGLVAGLGAGGEGGGVVKFDVDVVGGNGHGNGSGEGRVGMVVPPPPPGTMMRPGSGSAAVGGTAHAQGVARMMPPPPPPSGVVRSMPPPPPPPQAMQGQVQGYEEMDYHC